MDALQRSRRSGLSQSASGPGVQRIHRKHPCPCTNGLDIIRLKADALLSPNTVHARKYHHHNNNNKEDYQINGAGMEVEMEGMKKVQVKKREDRG